MGGGNGGVGGGPYISGVQGIFLGGGLAPPMKFLYIRPCQRLLLGKINHVIYYCQQQTLFGGLSSLYINQVYKSIYTSLCMYTLCMVK